MKVKFTTTIFLLLISFLGWTQKQDSLVLSFSEFIKTVKENHPVSKQSELLIQSAEAGILSARGNFDPKLYYNIDQKQFDNKTYWSLQNGGIKIPTIIGLELSTGVEQSFGAFLNNESISSVNGLAYTQLSLPLLQGLLIDERRFALKQSKLFKDLSLIDQKNMLNELFSKASKAYWDWVQSYYNLLVYRESVVLAELRLQGIKQAAIIGENAAIDTLEAGIQYQDRMVNLQQQEMDYFTKTMLLSVFLWTDKSEPAEFSVPVIPPNSAELKQIDFIPAVLNKIDSLLQYHPNLMAYQNKNARLRLELKLKQDKLKPQLNVKFNPLYDIGNLNSSILYGVNSYKWGVGFQYPLLLRKERGEVRLAKIKLADLNYEMQNKKLELSNKIKASVNEYSTTKQQATQYNSVVQNYYKLLLAEKALFEIGESSVFMVNSREMSYINSKIKLNELQFKFRKAGIDMLYNSGQLFNIQ